MLSTAGFASTEFAPKKFLEVRSADPHPIKGYIISKDKPNGKLSGFDDWLRQRPDDDVIWLIPKMERGNLHDVYKVAGGSISMVFEPSELIIVPR